jgi:hypothetical protein
LVLVEDENGVWGISSEFEKCLFTNSTMECLSKVWVPKQPANASNCKRESVTVEGRLAE